MSRKIIILIIICSLLFLSGCWDRLEPEQHAIVTAGGFDYNPERDMYQVIFQIVSPLTMAGGEQQADGTKDFWTVSAWGHSPYDAIANLRKKTSRTITFTHVKLYVFSKRMAESKGVLPIVNAIARSRQSRRIIILAITDSDVNELLSIDIPLESSNAIGLNNLINMTNQNVGQTSAQNANDFLHRFVQPGYEVNIGALELIAEDEEDEDDSARTPPVRIEGKYAFQKDKLVGFLNGRETRGCNWVDGNIDSATLVLKYPENEDIRVDVLISQSSSQIEPIIEKGKPRIKVTVKAQGHIVNTTGISSFKEESELTQSIDQRMAQVIRNDIKQGLERAQELESDVFGFGFAFYRLKNDHWKEMRDDWEQIFAELPVEIEIDATVKRSGLVNRDVFPN